MRMMIVEGVCCGMLSGRSSKVMIGVFLLILLGAMAYLNSFTAKTDVISTSQVSVPLDESDEAIASGNDVIHQVEPDELESKLVDTEIIDGYLVETYREYEIYKDEDGNVTKIAPTSNYNYLKYKVKLQ